MLKIAICDNDYKACLYLESIILNYGKNNNLIIECELFYSGEELCHYLKQNYIFDLIFLEIEMNQLNGIEIGKKIRNELNNHTTQIIYISTKYDYAPYLFKTKPLDFFVKPLRKGQIIDSIDRINEYLYTEKIFFEFSYNRIFYKIPFKNILYFENNSKKININTEIKLYEFYGKLTNVEKQIPNNFIRIHNSYIVNFDYVIEYHYDYVKVYNEDILTISQSRKKQIKNFILNEQNKHTPIKSKY